MAQTPAPNGDPSLNDDATKKIFGSVLNELNRMVPGEIEAGSELDRKLQEVVDLISARKVKEAQDILKNLEKLDSRVPPADLLLAAMAYSLGDNNTGRQLLESTAINHPDYPDLYFSFARLALGDNRITDADALSEMALKPIQQDAAKFSKVQMDHFKQRYYNVKYRVAKSRGQTEAAKAHVAAMEQVAPGSKQTLVAKAEIAFEEGDSGSALLYLRKLGTLQGTAETNPAEVTLASWYQRRGKADEAGKLLQQAASERPRDAQVQFALAQWSINQEDFPATLAAVKAFEAIDGDTNGTRELRGKVAFAQGAYSLAENQFKKLSTDNPKNVDYANLYALSLAQSTSKEKQDMAVALAKKVAQAKSNNIAAVSSLAYVMMKAGQLEAARSIISQVAQQPNLNKEITFIVCYFLSETGQTDQAKQILEKVVDAKGLFLFRTEAKKLLSTVQQSSDSLPTPK